MPKGPKIPAPGQKGEEHTSFWTKAKWKANLLKGTLELGGKNLRPFGAYVLANALLKNKWVNTLDLSHNHLRNEGAMEISQLLRVNVYLMYLNLASNEITDTGGVAIASAFIPQPIPCQAGTWNRTISILNLSGNSLKDDSAIALASTIMYCADLRKLDVSRNKIRKDGCKALFSALKWNNDVVIVIHNNPLGDDGISHLCDSLAALKQLESYAQLNLELCDVGRRGSDSIAEIVSEKSLFHEVNLSRNNIGDVGCNVLMKSMISNPKCGLKILNLQDALLSDECATSIAHAIEANIETWGTLVLSYNKIGDKGGTRLAQAMEKNTVLQNLYLNHNQLGAVAAEALCTLIKTSKTLKFMDVRRNGLSEGVRIKFSDALKQSPSSGFRLDYGATESNDLGEEFLKKIIEYQTALKQRQGITNKKAA